MNQQRAWLDRVDRLVAELGHMTNRPARIEVDGKVIAHTVIHDHQFEEAIDELGRVVHYGRKKGH